jgi:hypothetical protein
MGGSVRLKRPLRTLGGSVRLKRLMRHKVGATAGDGVAIPGDVVMAATRTMPSDKAHALLGETLSNQRFRVFNLLDPHFRLPPCSRILEVTFVRVDWAFKKAPR